MKKISDFNSATEKYPVIYAGSATRPEFVDMPTIPQQQEGVAPMDTCPAQWWNAMWKLATRDINAFRDYVGDAFTEINNLLVKFNITLDDADSEQLYNFFHDDYVQNYLNGIFINKTGGTIDGDLHIKGDLSVDGIGEEVVSTELKVGANTITLRNDNPTPLGNTELAGVVTKNYDGNNHNNIIAINKNGEARTGDIDIATRILYSNDGTNFYTDESLTTPATIGATEEVRDTGNQTSGGVEIYEGITYSNDDTQPFLTRAEASQLPNGIALVWDAQNKKAVGGSSSGSSVIPTSTTVINNIPIANNSAIKVMFTADISDTNATGGITPLTITYNSISIPVKANKNGALVDVLAKEVQTNIWKYLQAYTTLELVYQSDYDGQGNPAFIIVGNPIVLSSTDYTIYADGLIDYKKYSTSEVNTGKKWIDGKPIYRKVFDCNISVTTTWTDTGIIDNVIDSIISSTCWGYDMDSRFSAQYSNFQLSCIGKNTSNNHLFINAENRGTVRQFMVEYTKTTD
jgi:hypothetical protein